MIYRGYDIIGNPNGTEIKVELSGVLVKTFPFITTDEKIMEWIDKERKDRLTRGW